MGGGLPKFAKVIGGAYKKGGVYKKRVLTREDMMFKFMASVAPLLQIVSVGAHGCH